MKVLLLTGSLTSGGAERQIVSLAVLLKKHGYDTCLITYAKGDFYRSLLEAGGVKYDFCPELYPKFTRIQRLYKKFKEISPDIIISYMPPSNIPACLANIFYKGYLIVSERAHTDNFGIMKKIQFGIYRLANKVVPNSFSEADNISEHFPFLRSKITTIRNSVDVNYFKPIQVSKKNTVPKILCVGRVTECKNILRFIEAVKISCFKGLKFNVLWVGSQSDKKYLSKVKNKIIKESLSDIFILKDQTPDIVAEYQKADFSCLPSIHEGYPNALCEAMSCGLPVICSRVDEMTKIVQDGINGYLFDPYDAEEISEAICKIVSLSNQEYVEMGYRNREYIIENCSQDKFLKSYIQLFPKVK